MPALFIFLFKVNIALLLFCLGYYLVLRHLTFYTLNRIYLVIAIVFSTAYPQINLSNFAQRHQELAQPVQNVIRNWKAPAENFVKPLNQPDYWQWADMVFWAGVALMAGRLLMQLFSLYKLYRNSKPGHIYDQPVRLIRDNISPFSFWRSIFINPDNLSANDLRGVMEHEQVHVSEWHTLDILLAELSTIFYWFNPGVWLMKKAVRENIEFITDRKILQKGIDSKQYQYSLVNVSFAASPNTIVNHFNISTIKKRIIMMNAKRSAGYNLTRYVVLVPVVIALLLVFSLSKAAITKNGLHTIKNTISAAVSNINVVVKPFISPVKTNNVKRHADKPHNVSADTIYAGKSKSKDGKDKSFMITSDQGGDSLNYVINGVKATRAELKAMDAGRIESVELVPADKAKEFFPALDNDREVLFVTTDDSDAGKKLKEKMDMKFGYGKIAGQNISINRMHKYSDATPMPHGTGLTVITEDVPGNAPMAAASVLAVNDSTEAPVFLNSSGNGVSTSVMVVGKPKTKAWANIKNNLHVTIDPNNVVVIKQGDWTSPKVEALTAVGGKNVALANVYSVNGVAAKSIYKLRPAGESRINNISDKLIFIDGKQATPKDMKTLKINDIKSMEEKADSDTKKKYGDKAKNGVLFITTKKDQ